MRAHAVQHFSTVETCTAVSVVAVLVWLIAEVQLIVQAESSNVRRYMAAKPDMHACLPVGLRWTVAAGMRVGLAGPQDAGLKGQGT